jgi:hypothetical protein
MHLWFIDDNGYVLLFIIRECLKIPNGSSEVVNRRMRGQYSGQKKTDKKIKSISMKPYTVKPLDRGWSVILRQFLLNKWHPSCYLCYNSGDKSWTRKNMSDDVRVV